MRKPNEDVTKLPEWAQRKIEALENKVKFWKDQFETIENSRISYQFSHNDPKKYLLEDINYDFDGIQIRLDTDKTYPEILIIGWHELFVAPMASNSIRVFTHQKDK